MYSAAGLIPAAVAMSRVVVAWKPRSANDSTAAWSSRYAASGRVSAPSGRVRQRSAMGVLVMAPSSQRTRTHIPADRSADC